MTKVVVLTDTTDYKLPPAVEASYNTVVTNAVANGVQTAIAGMSDVTTAVANAVTAMTTPTILKNVNVIPSTGKNAVTGWFHTEGYGAGTGDPALNRINIQATITAANAAYTATGAGQRVYLTGFNLVDSTAYLRDDNTQDGIVSLILLDGVELFGPGTLKVKNAAYGSGAHYAMIRAKSGGLTRAKIRDITFDGNRSGNVASQQCNNIELGVTDDVEVSNTRHGAANGNAIILYGSTSGSPATNVRIKNNDVNGCNFIGIQASQFDGLDIDNNTVANCVNNGIDVYGENGTTTTHGYNFRITNNRVYACSAGIFPETVSWGLIQGNILYNNTESGVHVNRINGAPFGIAITGNQCTGGPYGIYITGDMFPGAIRISGNTIDGVTSAGIKLGGGGSNVSYVYIANNFIDTATVNTQPLIHVASGTPVWSQTIIRGTISKNTSRSLDVYDQSISRAGTVSFDAAND